MRRNPPQEQPHLTTTDHREYGLSLRQALRTRQFWTLCIMQFSFFPSLVTIPVHIVAHGVDLGMTTASAATVLSVIGGISIAGRLLVGTAADRVGGRWAMFICFTLLLSSLLWILSADMAWMLFVFAALYGFAHGGFFTVVSPTVAEYFGMTSHGAVFGAILFSGTFGGALGPLIAGWLFDTAGSYELAFSGLAALAFIGLLLTLTLRPMNSRLMLQPQSKTA